MANNEDLFKQIIAHAKEYGFIFPSSEIYDGLSAVYDYGQNGVELKNNIKQYWWKAMVQYHENIVGLDSAIFMHPTIWKASGHVDAFNDPLIDNKDSKKRYRADVLIEDHIQKIEDKIDKEIEKAKKRFNNFDEVLYRQTNTRVVQYQQQVDSIRTRFAELMNNKALQLGLSSTHFVTPHGLDNAGHYTTAHDFAILTDYALCNPQFMQIVGTKSYTVTINNSPKTVTNTNELLGVIPEVYGVKTGYTSQAGRCLITAAKQDNLDIIVIVFGADTKNIRTNDSANLINYTLSTYTVINAKELILAKYNDYITHILPYTNIEKMSQPLQPQLDESFTEYYAIKKDDQDKIEVSLDDYDLKAPIKKDQPVAKITVNLNNHPIISTNIRSQTLITSTTPKQYLYHFLTHYKQYFKA